MPPEDLSLRDLASTSGCSVRTLRSWISQGLIPKPGRHGPCTAYPASTLQRIAAIIALQDQGLTTSAIADRLADTPLQTIPVPDAAGAIARTTEPQPPAANTGAAPSVGTANQPQAMASNATTETPAMAYLRQMPTAEPSIRPYHAVSPAAPLLAAPAHQAAPIAMRAYQVSPHVTILVQTACSPGEQRRIRHLLAEADRLWSNATNTNPPVPS